MTGSRPPGTASRRRVAPDPLGRGREAYARREWADAFSELSGADQAVPLEREDLERLAWSAALVGRDADLLKGMERLYQAHLDAGDRARAARAAFWVGFRSFSLGEMSRAGAWMGRTRRLIEELGGDCVEQGYLLLPEVHRRLGAGDFEAAFDAAGRAAGIGDRFADRDLGSFARCLQGMVRLRQARVPDGLALLDEAMLAATEGTLSPIVTGLIYCSAIEHCWRVYALDRAREWSKVLEDWCEAQQQLVTFTGTCRAHRAEILQLHGEWGRAIAEARRAAERFADTAEHEGAGPAQYQLGEIHRLEGDFAAAEKSYRLASQFGREPQPGLALLRLAQGNGEAAAGAIRRVLDATRDRMPRTRYLPAWVEIMLATGDLEAARAGARELEEIAAACGSGILDAIAAHARGAVLFATGDARGALAPLRHAHDAWRQAGAPYLAARLRVLIGQACRALGDEDGAALELDAARAVFDQLGARPDLARIAALPGAAPPAPPHGLTPRELEVLRLVAAGKTNKLIARELYLSEKTVDRHVSNIFNKLDVSSRAAATAYAYEHKLI